MKKQFTQLLMLATLPIALGLASCVDREDNPTDQPVTPEEQKLADFRQELTTNVILDLSPVAAGHKGMAMWNLKDDGTFSGLHMQKGTTTNYVTGGTHDADHVNSSLSQGTWEAFVDEPDIYGAEMLLSGFRTTVTDSEYGTKHTKTYYLMSEKTDSETGNTILLVVDHDMLHYTLCYNVSKETSVSAAPALLASAQTPSVGHRGPEERCQQRDVSRALLQAGCRPRRDARSPTHRFVQQEPGGQAESPGGHLHRGL